MYKLKQIVAKVLVLFLCLNQNLTLQAMENPVKVYEESQSIIEDDLNESDFAYFDRPYDLPYVEHVKTTSSSKEARFAMNRATSLPEYYNNVLSIEHESSVRNQGKEGVCWAFASNAVLESYLKKQVGSKSDFSENHMRYALSNNGGNTLGFNRKYDDGGVFDMAKIIGQEEICMALY